MKPALVNLLIAIALSGSSSLAAEPAACLGLKPESAPAFQRAAAAAGFDLKSGSIGDVGLRLTIIEAAEGMPYTDQQVEALGEQVRAGGALLLSVKAKPGRTPMRLAFMLPTTAWMVSGSNSIRGGAALAQPDAAFFGDKAAAVKGLTVPFFFEFRPFHAVERGQARYDRYERTAPWTVYGDANVKAPMLPPRSDWWSRPLLNRDWQIRARADDLPSSPLLLTGRYGAGRVVVFPCSIPELGDSPPAEAFWTATLRWLDAAATIPSSPSVTLPAPELTLDPAKHAVLAKITNPTTEPRRVQTVVRLSTWENAPIGDVLQEALLPANASTVIAIPAPKPSPTNYEALDDRDAFQVRLGVLSQDGASLLTQARGELDFTPAVNLTLATEEVRSLPYSIPTAPEPDKGYRLGIPIGAYAYLPGQTVHAVATVTNGVRNLASQARVEDETSPANPSTMALNDGAALAERKPDSSTNGWGYWEGVEGDNTLRFTFPKPVLLCGLVLSGAGDEYRNQQVNNPGAVIVEIDGHEVARADDLADRFLRQQGRVRLSFAPVSGQTARVRLPWTKETRRRGRPRLAEVEIEGTTAAPAPAVHGLISIALRDGLGGEAIPIASPQIDVPSLARIEIPISFALPPGDQARFFRLEATFRPSAGASSSAATPLLAVRPAHPLLAVSQLRPASAPSVGLIVTRGFREFFDNAVGTAEIGEGWGQPDDLVWAFERGLKQQGVRSPTRSGLLFASESDMRHYSTPWRTFLNGEEFYDVATSGLVERMKRDPHWKSSDLVRLEHSDRWDAGPDVSALHAWQDFEAFDAWLRGQGKPGLTGRTRAEITAELQQQYRGLWDAWQQARYIHAIRGLRDAFAREGKRIVLSAQGVPLIANPAEAKVVGEVVRGTSDDCTWGMLDEDVAFTTGRQMSDVAFNPFLAMSTLNQWGYVSAALNNPQWHVPVGTTEPSRRALYDRAFRGMLTLDGGYKSIHTYGYNDNAGYAYTLNASDYNAWHRVQEKHSLLTPDGPIGAGLVISTAHLLPAENRRFTCSGGDALPETLALMRAWQRLQEAGVAVAFSANAECLEKWGGNTPLILLGLEDFSEAEVRTLAKLSARGVPLAACVGRESAKLPAAAARLFGVTVDGALAGGQEIAVLGTRPVVASGRNFFLPVPINQRPSLLVRTLTDLLRDHLQSPLRFPAGTTGYGFTSNGRRFVVVEDWQEEGRMLSLRLHASPSAKSARAADGNTHQALSLSRDGADWVIQAPIRPGDGLLIAIDEQ